MKKLLALLVLFLIPAPTYAKNVVIIQHQEYPGYVRAHDSFVSTLSFICTDCKITEDFNANSNIKLLDEKVAELSARKDVDLIFTIGTHSTQRMINATKTIPIVFTGVADPQNAGIVFNWKSSYSNFTGVETKDYYDKVLTLLYGYRPFKKLGMIYLKGSPSHEAGIIQIKKVAKKLNFEVVYEGFNLRNGDGVPFPEAVTELNISSSLYEVCEKLDPKTDAFFVQSSNTFTREFDLFNNFFLNYKLLSIGDSINVGKGLAVGISKDENMFGIQCASYANRILTGTPPSALPMDVGVKLSIDINLGTFEAIGIDPPFELISAADNIY